MNIILLVLQLATPKSDTTPGWTRNLTQVAICNTKWGLDHRHVTVKMRKVIYALYGVDWTLRKNYEVDHLIPRELGGADDIRNLWVEPLTDAHKKDKEENRLHREVCKGNIQLEDAQRQMRDWNRTRK